MCAMMKMVIVICPELREEEVSSLMRTHDVKAFTLIKDVIGAGETGPKMGTQIWPGKSILIFAVVDDAKSGELKAALKQCSLSLYPSEGMRAFVMPIEEIV
jgi:CBS domain-containing protein